MAFREDFVWGAASSAYQTEGFPRADGSGDSIWDAFCRQPGAIANGEDGSVACDGYHRFAEDIGLLASLGLSAYRVSTSWARIEKDRGNVYDVEKAKAGTSRGSGTMTVSWTAVLQTALRHG